MRRTTASSRGSTAARSGSRRAAPPRRRRRGARPARSARGGGWPGRRRRAAPAGSVASRSKRAALDEQELAAPGGAVRAEAGAVPAERQRRTVEAVLRHRRGGVGVVVLHRDHRDPERGGALAGVAGGEVERVEVAGDELGAERQERLEPRHRLLEGGVGLEPVEVADVRSEGGLVAAREAAGVLELRADRQHRPREAGATRTGRGTNPRARRITSGRPATTRATESSQREAMGRSCTRKTSAIAGEARAAPPRPRRRWARR